MSDTKRTYHETVRTQRGIEPIWPTEYWWCLTCGESSGSDPCEFCGEPIERYLVEQTQERLPKGQHE